LIARRNALILRILRALSLGAVALVALLAAGAAASPPIDGQLDLTLLSLEDLMAIEVTSVSRKAEHISDAPAAVYVLTGEEIRRSGATTIPDALRFVPGLQVARVSSNWWAVTSRGFAGNFANKLLVLIDGRSVYTPFFAGVYWDAQDVLLEDVDRIEVIRGPGATLWGANAVNGVINIITKDAGETRGLFAHAGVGVLERGLGSVRYGMGLSPNASLRAYGKHARRAAFTDTSGESGEDEWDATQGGIRLDWDPSPTRRFTVVAGVVKEDAGGLFSIPTLTPPYQDAGADTTRLKSGNVLLRWNEKPSATSELSLQAYFDRFERKDIRIGDEHSTIDLELQHRWRPHRLAEVTWGAGYRAIADEIDSTTAGYVTPNRRTVDVVSGFGQVEIELAGGTAHFIAGSKFERTDYTGFELQPSARVLLRPSPRHSLWGSVSRAVRTPSRAEQDIVLKWATIPPSTPENPLPYPGLVTMIGTDDFRSEVLTAYEAGYRFQPGSDLSLDLGAFYHRYVDLRTGEAGEPEFRQIEGGTVSWFVLPFRGTNYGEGQSYGAEVAADWRASRWIWLRGGYSLLRLDVWIKDGVDALELEAAEGASPEHQAFLKAFVDLPRRVGVDVGARYVDVLPELEVESYFTLDARIGWRPIEKIELFAVGTNLIEPKHVEFPPQLQAGLYPVERALFGGVNIRY
jgi:iron complex outermembrane receptor protein